MSEKITTYTEVAKTFTIEKKPGSEVEISGEIPYEALVSFRKEAIKNIASELEMPGFRKGHVPEDIALRQVGELEVLQEAANMYLRELYPTIVETHELDVIGRPEIHITKLAPENAVGLHIHTAVYPAFTLPKNWKDIAAKVAKEEPKDVTEKDLEEALTSIRRAHAKANSQVPVAPDAEVKEEELPALTDEFAKSLGNFMGVTDLTEKLRANMVEERHTQARDKRRGNIIDALIEKLEVDVPALFVASEQEKIIGQMKDDVARFGLTFEGYLEQVGKTEEALREEFKDQAVKRAKLQMMLNKIAAEEKVEADEKDVNEEMKHALEHFPEAKQELLRVHVETVLRNEKVLQMVEQLETK